MSFSFEDIYSTGGGSGGGHVVRYTWHYMYVAMAACESPFPEEFFLEFHTTLQLSHDY